MDSHKFNVAFFSVGSVILALLVAAFVFSFKEGADVGFVQAIWYALIFAVIILGIIFISWFISKIKKNDIERDSKPRLIEVSNI